jgi:hypothetical protein
LQNGRRQLILNVELTLEPVSQQQRYRGRRVHLRIHAIEWLSDKVLVKTRLTSCVNQRASDDKDYPRNEACLTETMSEARVSESSDLETGEAGERRINPPKDLAMEMTTAAIRTTKGATISEPMERNENGKRRRNNEAPGTALAPSDWRCRMERRSRQQAQEPTERHRTVGHLTNLLQAHTAGKEAQWLRIRMWMQEREQKWDARDEDDQLWGAGITIMIAKVMKGVAPGPEAREKDDTRL